MRRVNADNLFYGEVLVDRHVWIDANTRGMNEDGEKSIEKGITCTHKVIVQITNWRFLITILDGAISEHKGYWDFSWSDIKEISSSNNWATIVLKDNTAIALRQDDAHISSIKLWAISEAIKTEQRNVFHDGDVWQQSQEINLACETKVPRTGDWTLNLKSYVISLTKGDKPKRIEWHNELTIDIVKRAFSKKNIEKRDNDDFFGGANNHPDIDEKEASNDKTNKNDEYIKSASESKGSDNRMEDIWGVDQSRCKERQRSDVHDGKEPRGATSDRSKKDPRRQRRSPSQQKVINDINALIGLDEVKDRVIDIVNLASINEERVRQGLKTPVMSLHMVFTGNPGTGKTTIARMLGDVFGRLGLLSKGHFVEIDRAGLVGAHLGQTAIKTTAVLESALGGVLFIDEAYALSPGLDGDQFGQEAIDTILAFMENNRDDIVVIAAGYTDEMNDFINSNPGLRSRFNTFINFSDYSPEEMKKIFLSMAYADKYIVNGICDAGLDEIFSRLSARAGKGFGNGREVRNIYEKALLMQNRRLMSLDTLDRNRLVEILPCDLPLQTGRSGSESTQGKPSERDILNIDKLIGITGVKKEIKKIVDMARVAKIRSEAGLPLMSPSLHMVFTGSPGTGKTTVARCLSQELYELGVLARNQIIEVSRSDLVAGYLGQTAIKTTKVLDSALGGVLFVDEAYTLNQEYAGGSDSFGLEAIDTILKYMEDNKDSLMVIVAGYHDQMSRFLASNPGLSSRFNRYVHFEDYSDAELLEVFRSMADANKYVLHKDAFVAIENAISALRQKENSKFSNARAMRNLFERTIENQATRLVKINQPSRDEIQLIISDDLCDL